MDMIVIDSGRPWPLRWLSRWVLGDKYGLTVREIQY